MLSRAAYFLLFILIGNIFGVTGETDSVFILLSALTVLMNVSASVADVIVMPLIHKAERAERAWTAFISLLKSTATILPFLTLLFMLLGYLVFREFDLILLFILFPIPTLHAVSLILTGALNANRRLTKAALGPLYGSIGAICTIPFMSKTSISIAFILLSYEITRLIILGLHAKAIVWTESIRSAEIGDLLRASFKNSWLQALAALFIASNPLVDMYFANSLEQGSATTVEYAIRFANMVYVVFVGFMSVIYFRFSKSAADDKIDRYYVYKSAVYVGISALLLCALVFFMSPNIITTLYVTDELSFDDKSTLANLLKCYIAGAWLYVGGIVFIRALSAEGRIDCLLKTAVIAFLSNLLLNFVLVDIYGLYGIGIATSLTYLITLIYLVVSYRK